LSPNGLFLFALGPQGNKDGQFQTTTGIAVNDNLIALLDTERKALLFYDAGGKFSFEVANKLGKPPVWSNPIALTTDSDGRFYVLDQGSSRVRIFNAKGQFLSDFGANGKGIVAGPNHKVLVLAEKNTFIYSAHVVPRAIQNVTATDQEGDIKIEWDKNPEAATYRVYNSSDGSTYNLVFSTTGGPLVHSALKPGVTYRYAVTGVNDINYEGSWGFSKPIKASRRKDVSLISISKVSFDSVFSAAFKYYVNKPVGSIVVQNNDDKPYRNVKLSMTLKKYTDFATEKVIPSIGPGEQLSVPVTMTFNSQVLELTENTPVQVDIKLSYFEDNIEKTVGQNAPITIYSRNAISWNDNARVSSFITPQDGPIVDFTRMAIRAFLAPLKASTVTKPLAKTILFFETMRALGITYVPDPLTPITEVLGHPETLDYVQFPRETLRRKTGDCDDTSSLLAALLESVGVQVAMVYTPGHIFLMSNTEESDPGVIGLAEERFVEYKGTYWVPVETTLLSQDFTKSWQAAISEVNAAKEKNQVDFVPVIEAAEKYPPVTLIEPANDMPAFPEEKVSQTFPVILAQLQNERYQAQLALLTKEIEKDPQDKMLEIQLGMAHVEGGKSAEGGKIFTSLLEDPSGEVKASAHNNLGNIAFLNGSYKEAADHYAAAAGLTPEDGAILINQARAAWKLGDTNSTKQFLTKAKNVQSDWHEYVGDIPTELLPK